MNENLRKALTTAAEEQRLPLIITHATSMIRVLCKATTVELEELILLLESEAQRPDATHPDIYAILINRFRAFVDVINPITNWAIEFYTGVARIYEFHNNKDIEDLLYPPAVKQEEGPLS